MLSKPKTRPTDPNVGYLGPGWVRGNVSWYLRESRDILDIRHRGALREQDCGFGTKSVNDEAVHMSALGPGYWEILQDVYP